MKLVIDYNYFLRMSIFNMQTLVDNSPKNPILMTIEFYLVYTKEHHIHSSRYSQDRRDRLETIFENTLDSAGLVTLSNENLKDMLICCQLDIKLAKHGFQTATMLDYYHKLPKTKFYKHGIKSIGRVGAFAIDTAKRIIPLYVKQLPLAKREKYYRLVHKNKVNLDSLILL